jgi:pyruvate carboxylase
MDVLTPGKKLNFPKSVVEMMEGQLGCPTAGGRRCSRRSSSTRPAQAAEGPPGAKMPKVDFAAVRQSWPGRIGREPRDVDVMSYLMYPQVFLDYDKHLKAYDNTA